VCDALHPAGTGDRENSFGVPKHSELEPHCLVAEANASRAAKAA